MDCEVHEDRGLALFTFVFLAPFCIPCHPPWEHIYCKMIQMPNILHKDPKGLA